MQPKLGFLLVLAVAVAVVVAVPGFAERVQVGNLVVEVDGNPRPNKLPKRERAPIGLEISSDIGTVDGSQPPAISTIEISFDRDGTLVTKGLPRCDPNKIENTTTPQARKACARALVGTGHATAAIALPGQAPFTAKAPLLAFNGTPQGGKPVVVIHAYAFVPAPTTFVVRGVVSNLKGRYGKRVYMEIPPISGGYGSMTHFDVFIKRLFRVKGERHSFLVARCSRGNLQAEGTYTFVDGTSISGTVVRGCSPRG